MSYFSPNAFGLVDKVSWSVRKKMFDTLMRTARPTEATRVLDVGVTNDPRADSNFFEKLYPYPHRITAVGTEDASFLERDHPGLKFVRADGMRLPFADRSFDLVISTAVIEHVGNRQNQAAFLKELARVGRACFVTTPNRWYPLEFHTLLPFAHWLPGPVYRPFLKRVGLRFYAEEANLNLLGDRDFRALLPLSVPVQAHHERLLGVVSNLVYYWPTA